MRVLDLAWLLKDSRQTLLVGMALLASAIRPPCHNRTRRSLQAKATRLLWWEAVLFVLPACRKVWITASSDLPASFTRRPLLLPGLLGPAKTKINFAYGFLTESWCGTSSIGFRSRRHRICRCFCVRSIRDGQFRVRMRVQESC